MGFLVSTVCAAAFLQFGGGSEQWLELPGRSRAPALGTDLAPFVDHDGDGIPDYLVGADGSAMVVSGATGKILLEMSMPAVASFGEVVSRAGDVDGDGIEDVLVGAPLASPGGLLEAGSAYLFSGAGGQLLHEWHGSAYGRLGAALAPMTDVDGDGTPELAVAAPEAGPAMRGKLHLYSGASGLELHVLSGSAWDNFGADLALADDIDLDGVPDLVVGAPGFEDPGVSWGALYLLSGVDGALIRRIDLPQIHGVAQSYRFGADFDLVEDMDGDGVQEVVLGLSDANQAGWIGQGWARVYSLATGALQHDLVGAQDLQFFGSAVASIGDVDLDGRGDFAVVSVSPNVCELYSGTGTRIASISFAGDFVENVTGAGDLDLDGVPDLVMAAPFSNLVAAVSGASHLELHRVERQASHAHGSCIARIGDVDGDGQDDLAVGDPEAGPGNAQGAVTVYSGVDGAQLLVVRGARDDSALGTAILGLGDVDGDGFDDFLAGAPGWTAVPAGVVTAFSGRTGAVLYSHTGLVGGRFGQTLAHMSDLDGDGIDEFLVGEPLADAVEIRSGADGRLVRRVNGPQPGIRFGHAVASADVDGDGLLDLIIGSPWAKPWSPNWRSGSVQVLSALNGSLLFEAQGPNSGDAELGHSVAAAGDVDRDGVEDFMAGAPGEGSGFSPKGTVYVWSGATGALLHRFEGSDQGMFIGNAVSSAGDINRDGHADLLLGSDGDGFLLHAGATGAILMREDAAALEYRLGKAVAPIGDLDGDGAPEIGIGAPHRDPQSGGNAFVFKFAPYMSTDSYAISIAAGGRLGLSLDFPDAVALHDYKVLVSTSGAGPGPFGVPLTPDAVTRDSYLGNYPFPMHQGLQGVLDAQAEAQASIGFPAGMPSRLLGLQFWLAAVALLPAQEVEAASVALPFVIGP